MLIMNTHHRLAPRMPGRFLIAGVCWFHLARLCSASEEFNIRWSIDKDAVCVGGNITISMARDDFRKYPDLSLAFSTRPVVELDKCAQRLDTKDSNQFFVWIDHSSAQIISEDPLVLRSASFFQSPGTLDIRLRWQERDTAPKTVKVVACGPEAKEVEKILFPAFTPGTASAKRAAAWPIAFSLSFENLISSRDLDLDYLLETLPILRQHPDWKEPASQIVLLRGLQRSLHSEVIKPIVTKGEAVSEELTLRLRRISDELAESAPASLFAAGLKTRSRSLLDAVERGGFGFRVDLTSRPASAPAATESTGGQREATETDQAILVVPTPE